MLPVLFFRVIFSLKAKILFEENTRKNIGISIFHSSFSVVKYSHARICVV